MVYCEACGNTAGEKRKFRDPRKEANDDHAYAEHFFCSEDCELAIIAYYEKLGEAQCVT